ERVARVKGDPGDGQDSGGLDDPRRGDRLPVVVPRRTSRPGHGARALLPRADVEVTLEAVHAPGEGAMHSTVDRALHRVPGLVLVAEEVIVGSGRPVLGRRAVVRVHADHVAFIWGSCQGPSLAEEPRAGGRAARTSRGR